MDERTSTYLCFFVAILLAIFVYSNIPKPEETQYEKGWRDACRSVYGKVHNDNGTFSCISISTPHSNCSYEGNGFTITSGTSYELFTAYMGGKEECRCPSAVIVEYSTSQIYDPDYGMMRNASHLIRCFEKNAEGGEMG
jgi:hypothetical protein